MAYELNSQAYQTNNTYEIEHVEDDTQRDNYKPSEIPYGL